MNLVLNPTTISVRNCFFMDTKTNIIMDGTFTKIAYSTATFSMNGLYAVLPIRVIQTLRLPNKNVILFDPKMNREIVNRFSELEREILVSYAEHFGIGEKKQAHTLKHQFLKGSIKYYRAQQYEESSSIRNYYMVISGVWENLNEIGITYKIIEHVL